LQVSRHSAGNHLIILNNKYQQGLAEVGYNRSQTAGEEQYKQYYRDNNVVAEEGAGEVANVAVSACPTGEDNGKDEPDDGNIVQQG